MKKYITDHAAKHSWALQVTRPWEMERFACHKSPLSDVTRRSLAARTKAVVAYDRIMDDMPHNLKFPSKKS